MDKLDRMLRVLPEEEVPGDLAGRIGEAVRRRHRRAQAIRRAGASLLAVLGVWLLWPGIVWISSNELFVSGAAWLSGSLEYLNYGSVDALGQLWNGAASLQGAVGSAFGVSIVLGALFLCSAIFLAIDPASWRAVPGRYASAGQSTILASGLHS